MSNPLVKFAIRSKFHLTSRDQASTVIRREASAYQQLIADLSPLQLAQPVRVPKMLGVDEDMRDWSILAILEHNLIVNRSIAGLVRELATGEPAKRINPKTDVMPSAQPGMGVIAEHQASVDAYLSQVTPYPELRKTATLPHPLFGKFTAHLWHCMFGFHLGLHRKQAEAIRAQLLTP